MTAVTPSADARAAYEALIAKICDAEPRHGYTSERDLPALDWADFAIVLRVEPELIHEVDLDGVQIAEQLAHATITLMGLTLLEALKPVLRSQVLRDVRRESERRDDEKREERALFGFYGQRAFEEGHAR